MMTTNLEYLEEPLLEFGLGQAMQDPRDGLTLFGPLDRGVPHGVRIGAVGTPEGLVRLRKFLSRLSLPVASVSERVRPSFPGFEAAFRATIDKEPVVEVHLKPDDIGRAIGLAERERRTFAVTSLWTDAIGQALDREEAHVDVWMIVVPEEVYRYCRPKSPRPARIVPSRVRVNRKQARRARVTPFLFDEWNAAAGEFLFQPDFRNQLKARLLKRRVAVQVVRESVISWSDFLDARGKPVLDLGRIESGVFWNLSTALYYKAGGRPWRLRGVRDGVCYLGLVFKKSDRVETSSSACCAAQMFLDSGDGVVFRGALGPWYQPASREFHLSEEAARSLISTAVESYRGITGQVPREIFVHGRVTFSDEEWRGLSSVSSLETKVVGVKIRDDVGLRLYRPGRKTVLRGTALILSEREAILWTRGHSPRLGVYPGLEVPRPTRIKVERGDADLSVVLRDVLALTKLNYNSCLLGDGSPVTLKFADRVGEVLTAAPNLDSNSPLPFKFYI